MSFLKKIGQKVWIEVESLKVWVPGRWVVYRRDNPNYTLEELQALQAAAEAQRYLWMSGTDKPQWFIDLLNNGEITSTGDNTVVLFEWIPGYFQEYPEGGYWATDSAPGWNAGAHSIVWLQQPPPGHEGITARYTFKARKESLGIFVGLASNDAGTSPSDVLAGVYLSMGQWRPVRDGEKLSGSGTFEDGTLFTLDLTPAGLQISTSDASEFVPYIMPSAVCLDAALYLMDDEILSAGVVSGGGQLGVLAALEGVAAGTDRVPTGHADSTLAPVVGAAGVYTRGEGVLAPVLGQAVGGRGVAWGSGDGVLASVSGMAGGSAGVIGSPVGSGFQQASLAPVIGIGIVKSGYSGQQHDGTLAPLYDALAYGGMGHALSGQVSGNLTPAEGASFGFPKHPIVILGGYAYAHMPMTAQVHVAVVLNSRGQIITILDAQAILGANLSSQGQALGSMDGDMSLLAYIDSVVRGADGLQGRSFADGGQVPNPSQQMPGGTEDYDGGYFVWVFNARTGAVSRYLRYGFDSFAQIGGHYFGVAEDGVYLLEGNTDAGQRIEARAGTGLLDLGAKELKHVSAVYLDAASDGVLSVRVQAGQQQYTYQARRASQYNAQQRVDVGRGLRATHYSFELLNSGADFELDAMDVNVVKSARRI